jgi:hypothetical protein
VDIHLGVTLEIWGPEFTGRAMIDLSIISFTIAFGSGDKDTRTAIGWDEFLAKLMPGAPPPGGRRAGPGGRLARGRQALRSLAAGEQAADADPPVSIVQIVPQGGLIKRLSDTDGDLNWVFNGEELRLTTVTAIPVKDWTFSDNVRLAPNAPKPNQDFGVGPVGVASDQLTSTHTVAIATNEPSVFLADPVISKVPTALWQTRDFDKNGVPRDLDPLNGTTVDGAYTGFTISPLVTGKIHTRPIPVGNLDYTVVSPVREFAWTDATGPATDPFDGQTVWGTIAAPGPQTVRGQLVDAIARQRWPVPGQVDVTELSSLDAYDLLANPTLRLLGEQR